MINEDISNKLVNLEIRMGKATAKELIKVMRKLFECCREKGQTLTEFLDNKVRGNSMPLKALIKKGGVDNITLKENDFKEIKKELNKYGVKFSVIKDRDTKEYSLFFQSNNTSVIDMAFKNILKKNEEVKKESILLKLRKFKGKVKENIVKDRIKSKVKEQSL